MMNRKHSARSLLAVVAAPVLVSVLGCGGGPSVVEVSGTVTRGGVPVPDLVVNFEPDKGRPSWGFTDPQGRYTLHYTKDQDGVEVGHHRVYVNYQPEDTDRWLAITERRFEYPPDIKAIEEKYGNRETTPLEFDIQESQEIDLKLD